MAKDHSHSSGGAHHPGHSAGEHGPDHHKPDKHGNRGLRHHGHPTSGHHGPGSHGSATHPQPHHAHGHHSHGPSAADHHHTADHHSGHHGHHDHHGRPLRRPSQFGFFIRIVALGIALTLGVGGGLWLKAYNSRPSNEYTDDMAGKVVAQCEQLVPKLDCRCLWKQAGVAFTPSNSVSILEILSQRHQWTGQITRARLEQVAGNDGASALGKALYYCTLL